MELARTKFGKKIFYSVGMGLCLLATAGMIVSMRAELSESASAAGVVVLDDRQDLVVYPGENGWNETDLFTGLKDAMPGDVLVDEIEVRNEADFDLADIYLHAEAYESDDELSDKVAATETLETMRDFLSQLTMRVYNDGDLIFENSPSEVGELGQDVLLGTFERGESKILRLELEVPADLGVEYMHRAGEIAWVFSVDADEGEIIPVPDTGAFLAIAGGAVSGFGVGFAAVMIITKCLNNKKKSKKKK